MNLDKAQQFNKDMILNWFLHHMDMVTRGRLVAALPEAYNDIYGRQVMVVVRETDVHQSIVDNTLDVAPHCFTGKPVDTRTIEELRDEVFRLRQLIPISDPRKYAGVTTELAQALAPSPVCRGAVAVGDAACDDPCPCPGCPACDPSIPESAGIVGLPAPNSMHRLADAARARPAWEEGQAIVDGKLVNLPKPK